MAKETKESIEKRINDAINFALKYKPQQHRKELFDFLMFAIQKGCKSVLEIGCGTGGTTFILSQLFKKVVAIDRTKDFTFSLPNLTFIKMDTQLHDPEKLLQLKGIDIDLIFIDGLHTSEGVANDYFLFNEYLVKGGIIAFHDIKQSEGHAAHNCFVDRFWNKIKAEPEIKTKEFISNENSWMSGIPSQWANKMDQFGGIGVIY